MACVSCLRVMAAKGPSPSCLNFDAYSIYTACLSTLYKLNVLHCIVNKHLWIVRRSKLIEKRFKLYCIEVHGTKTEWTCLFVL